MTALPCTRLRHAGRTFLPAQLPHGVVAASSFRPYPYPLHFSITSPPLPSFSHHLSFPCPHRSLRSLRSPPYHPTIRLLVTPMCVLVRAVYLASNNIPLVASSCGVMSTLVYATHMSHTHTHPHPSTPTFKSHTCTYMHKK